MIRFHKLDPDAIIPTKNSGDAGYDLYSLEDVFISPGERVLVKTGISVNLAELQEQRHCWPSRWFTPVGLIRDRSGVSSKTGLKTMAGVIDRDYTGEIKVLIVNLNLRDSIKPNNLTGQMYDDLTITDDLAGVRIKKGDKIAQMIITVAYDGGAEESETPFKNELRGDKGFGSTDK